MDYNNLQKNEIKQTARGREIEILQNVAGIPLELLDGEHHPCPRCGGKDRFRLVDKEAGAVLCNQCFRKKNGDFIAAVQWALDITFPDALEVIAEYLGFPPDAAAQYGVKTSRYGIKEIIDQEEEGEDLTAYFASCVERLDEADYLRKRGISDETARRAGVGFDAGTKEIIIPTGRGTYTARTTAPNATNRYRNHGKAGLFNAEVLQEAAGPVFIGEGAINALSIIEAGGEAVALGSAAMAGRMLDCLKVMKPAIPLLITLDNDKTGNEAASKLENGLLEAGLNAFSVDITAGYNDPNDFLLADREGFIRTVQREIGRAEGRPAPASKRTESDNSPLPFIPFPTEALPAGPMRNLAEAYHASTGKDAAYIAPILLAGVASIFGCSRRVQLNEKGDWLAPMIIYAGIVGPSGSGKSPAQNITQAPFDGIQTDFYHDYKKELQEFQKTIEGKKAPDWNKAPILAECMVGNITTEALSETLYNNPYGVMSFQDELAGWFNSFNQYKRGGNDEAIYLSLFNGKNIKVNRKTRFSDGSNVRLIENPAFSLAGGIQPEILRRIGRENPGYLDSGLFFRFLLAYPPDPTRTSPVQGIDANTRDEYRALIYRLFGKREDDGGRLFTPAEPQIFYLSREASRLFNAFDLENEEERGRRDDRTKGILPKLTDYAGRVAGVLHLVKHSKEETPDEIDAETMADAVKIVRWFRHEAYRVMTLFGHGPRGADQEKGRVLNFLQKRGADGPENGMTAREIGNGLYRGPGSTERAGTVLARLKNAGEIRASSVKNMNGGPVTDRFYLLDGQ